MSLQAITAPKLFSVHMLQKERVATDRLGLTSEIFEVGQEVQLPLEAARSLVLAKIARWVGPVPPDLDKKTQAYLVEEERKSRSFPGFTVTKVEVPTVHFTHSVWDDNKQVNHDLTAVFVDFKFWDQPPPHYMDDDRYLTWNATARMQFADYIKDAPARERLHYAIEGFTKTLSGERREGIRFSFDENEPNRVYVQGGYGGCPGFLLCDAKVYPGLLTSFSTVDNFATLYQSRYAPTWIYELLLWQGKRN